jgi:small conductance mechanosensitive channel
VIIPNRLILEVQNHSRGTTSVAVQVPVSPAEDPKRVQESLQRAVTLAADQGVAAATVTGVTAFASARITWTVSAPATAANLSATDRTLRQAIAEALYQDSITLAGMVQKGSSHG